MRRVNELRDAQALAPAFIRLLDYTLSIMPMLPAQGDQNIECPILRCCKRFSNPLDVAIHMVSCDKVLQSDEVRCDGSQESHYFAFKGRTIQSPKRSRGGSVRDKIVKWIPSRRSSSRSSKGSPSMEHQNASDPCGQMRVLGQPTGSAEVPQFNASSTSPTGFPAQVSPEYQVQQIMPATDALPGGPKGHLAPSLELEAPQGICELGDDNLCYELPSNLPDRPECQYAVRNCPPQLDTSFAMRCNREYQGHGRCDAISPISLSDDLRLAANPACSAQPFNSIAGLEQTCSPIEDMSAFDSLSARPELAPDQHNPSTGSSEQVGAGAPWPPDMNVPSQNVWHVPDDMTSLPPAELKSPPHIFPVNAASCASPPHLPSHSQPPQTQTKDQPPQPSNASIKCPHCHYRPRKGCRQSDQTNLNRHMRRMHAKKRGQWKCKTCGKVFERSDYHLNHVRTTHRKVNSVQLLLQRKHAQSSLAPEFEQRWRTMP